MSAIEKYLYFCNEKEHRNTERSKGRGRMKSRQKENILGGKYKNKIIEGRA
jgi:hypothetical protein